MTTTRSFGLACAFAVLPLLAGASSLACSSTGVVTMREGPREYVAADYDKLLSRWTRSERSYAKLGADDVLSADATFEAWEFRWAYVIRYVEDYGIPIDRRKELLTASLDDARTHHQFYVALYGNRPRDADLTAASPAWIVRLLDDKGHVTAPDEIIPIKRPGVLEKTYFPYTTAWRSAFRVRFPVATSAGPAIDQDASAVTLRFSGPLGKLDLQWTLVR